MDHDLSEKIKFTDILDITKMLDSFSHYKSKFSIYRDDYKKSRGAIVNVNNFSNDLAIRYEEEDGEFSYDPRQRLYLANDRENIQFEVKALKVYSKLLYLKFPEFIELTELRADQRIPLLNRDLFVEFHNTNFLKETRHKVDVKGVLFDISEGGVGIIVDKKLFPNMNLYHLGDEVEITCISDNQLETKILGRMTYIKFLEHTPLDNHLQLGIRVYNGKDLLHQIEKKEGL